MKRLLILAPVLLAGCVVYQRPSGWIPAREPLTAERMAAMKNEGMSDEAIRRELEFHGVAYKLTADDLVALKDSGAGEALMTAATSAPVKEPAEARPIYSRHSSYDCRYCHGHSAAPFYFATAFSLNYLFGHHWGHHHHRHRSRW